MATSRSRQNAAFNTASQERVEHGARIGGMAEAFAEASALAPQVLALQQALMAGVARSQQLEAKRLAARHSDDDPRIAAAVERGARFDRYHAEATERAVGFGRVVETFTHDGLFHGYVMQADGEPAVGYTVRLELATAESKRARRGSAKTDPTGYFRIALDAGGDEPAKEVDPTKRWTLRMARMLEDDGDETPRPAAAATTLNVNVNVDGQANAATTSAVVVLDPSGREVFQDPSPPLFDGMGSEFRYYVLELGGIAERARKR